MLLAPQTLVPQTLEGQGSGSGNAQATSSNAGPAIFDSATNALITGGRFTASQGNHANVTINISDSRIPRTSGAQVEIQNQPSAQNVSPNPNPNPRRRRRPNRPEANPIRQVQRSNEMYERHLALKGRGFPLWIPHPNIQLPIPYRAKGVCIGDVGIVTAFGDFDFLFNICRRRDDPINPEELPDKFAPIYPPLNPTDVRKFRGFSSGSYLASSSIVKSQTGGQTPGLTFESSASEGALLAMPDGAFQEELSNLTKFRDYVGVHAANWYKFVNGPRGREAQNGDVIVVVGCDKTTSWGMATTFANTSSAQQSNFRLTFRPLQSQHNAGTMYEWEHSGAAEVKVGPEPGENEELGETPTSQLRNQCLFMRTLSVTLSDSEWAETFPGSVSATNQEGSQPEHRGQCLHPPNPNTSSSSFNSARSNQGRRGSPSDIAEERDKDSDDEEGSTLIPLSSAPAEESVLSSSGDHVGSAGSSDTHDSDDIRPEKPFVDKLYNITDNLILLKCITWTNSGTSFITNLEMIPEYLELLRHNNFSNFVRQLNIHGFQVISRISPINQYQTWEFSHPKFIRGRPDLLHEIKLNDLEPRWNSATKDELPGDLVQAPGAQSDAMHNEITRVWDNPSKIINKYLLRQVPDAKVALTHDRDWSSMTSLSPSELIKEITLVNEITLDSVSGVVFLEPKNEISLITAEEQSIFEQIQGDEITLEQYLFGSSENHSILLHNLINQLRSDYMPFCDQYTMSAKETPRFLKGHPKRLLSLDDLVDIHQANFQSLLEHHYIHRLRNQLNALPPDDLDKGTRLLRLADVLSRRFWQLDQKDDLEEAIWYYEEALSLLPQTHYHFLEAILGVCSCVYQRFQLLGLLDDLKKLLECLHTEQNLNVESLLTPVKAQLQPRPTCKSSDSKEKPRGHPSHPSSSSVYLQKPTGSTTSTIHTKPSFTTDAVAPKQRYTDQQPDADTKSSSIDDSYPFAELPPRIFALIIGINKYESPRIPNLLGAVSDADAIRDYLQEHLGVPSTQIRNLRDSEATRAAIINGIKAFSLNDEIKGGNPILIYYAGHGGSADTPKGWEVRSTGNIELLFPYDYSSPLEDSNSLPDRTLEALLLQLADKKGNNITVILDCRHSGSGTRILLDRTLKARVVDVGNVPSNLDQDIWRVFESSKGLERSIFNGKASDKRTAPGLLYDIRKSEGETYVIDEGEAAGITMGTEFEVYEDLNSGQLLGIVVARELSAFSTTLYAKESRISLDGNGVAHKSRVGTEERVRVHVADSSLKNLVKNMDPSERIVQLLERDRADFGMALESGKVVFNIYDSDVAKHGLTRMPYILEPTVEAIYPVIRAAAHFYWHRRRTLNTSQRGLLAEKIKIGVTELELLERFEYDDELKPVDVYGPTGGWKRGKNFELKTGTEYGWKIINNCNVPLYPAFFYFDNSDWSITPFYVPPIALGIEPPLKGQGYLTVGYGDFGSDPHSFSLRKGQNVDVGILKLFLSRKQVNLSRVAQSSPFEVVTTGSRDSRFNQIPSATSLSGRSWYETSRGSTEAVSPEPKSLPLLWDTIEKILVVH